MSDSLEIVFVSGESDGPSKTVRGRRDVSILDAAHAGGMDIDATCGARGRCRSCRVKVLKGDVPPPTLQDTVQLGHEEVQERFRLACQTKLIDDCTVMPAPPKAEVGHQILTGGDRLSESDRVGLDSGVDKHVIAAKTPASEHHQTSDVEEILAALDRDCRLGPNFGPGLPIHILRKVPVALRKDKGTLTVTTFRDRIIDVEPGDTSAACYGMAFDIGTTSVVGTLLDLTTGEALADVGGVNPQAVYGGDLMSRIAFAQFDEKKLATLRAKMLNALNGFVNEACSAAEVSPDNVYKIVVVGNTCMHHVLLGVDVSYVGLAPYAPVVRDPLVFPAADLPIKAAQNAQICLLPIVAGFVGADTMACLLATRIYESDEIRALVDIGTNGEVVIGSKDKLMACSAPAGPALEGAQIRHGMRGAIGAIERVSIDGDVACAVIGDAPAIGICGSGLVDAVAKMIDARAMDSSGLLRREGTDDLPAALADRLVQGEEGREFVLTWKSEAGKDENITLTQTDIRQLQLAKSAIFSGIVMLQQIMNVADDDLVELMLCGGFGNYINVASAVKIRLLPGLDLDRITYVGNAAALGAQMALLSETERDRAFELAQRIEHVALAARPDFQEIFVDGMTFGTAAPAADKAEPALATAAGD